ncbi:MAG: hypothetical protein M0P94_04980 [Candidatus Absconditabacterales bacterium]|nr:hypothetical protein [Candidatus Absconditabacterales bacterium]
MKKLNYVNFIKENIDLLEDVSHHECERLVKKIMSKKFKTETGYYYDRFVSYHNYEEQKKEILKKIEEIGLTKKIYQDYHMIPYVLKKKFLNIDDCIQFIQETHRKKSDKDYLKIINMDMFIFNCANGDPIKERNKLLFIYFQDNGINTDDVIVTRHYLKVKKSSKEYKKIDEFIKNHNKIIDIMMKYEKI